MHILLLSWMTLILKQSQSSIISIIYSRYSARRCLKITNRDKTFFFDGKWYKQIDVMAKGSPLVPILVNIFISFHENRWLINCSLDLRLSLYCRLADYTFPFLKTQLRVQKFLQCMKSSLEYTATVNFILYKGLITKSHYFMSMNYRSCLINTLINRTHEISTSYLIFSKNIGSMIDPWKREGFPLLVTQRSIRQTLNIVVKQNQCNLPPTV